jgi:fructokinase
MISPSSAEANLLVLRHARAAGRIVSLDANVRLHQWPNASAARETIAKMFDLIDLLKVNEDEMKFLFGDTPAKTVYREQLEKRGVKALLMTLGGGGATVITPEVCVHTPAPQVEVIDTTGAGDAFLAGLLRAISIQLQPMGDAAGAWGEGLDQMDENAWHRNLAFANHIGALACTKFGATTAIPLQNEVPWQNFDL